MRCVSDPTPSPAAKRRRRETSNHHWSSRLVDIGSPVRHCSKRVSRVSELAVSIYIFPFLDYFLPGRNPPVFYLRPDKLLIYRVHVDYYGRTSSRRPCITSLTLCRHCPPSSLVDESRRHGL
ncbi:hypothetical protein OH76DRAFT_538475 [Lentinus brumalis]|uniref:Uncharacterized protein n=1 Tax=Lentinus brumalis TaxID=2498619 RepID=A0A371CHL1_9APHY|nr:hypothetical protein OH76DRAFT_538475 [Polyporus brumalis]